MVDVKLVGMTVPMKVREGLVKAKELVEDYAKKGIASGEELSGVASLLEHLVGQFTAEPIIAAFSRISRSPDSVTTLLEKALIDIPKSRVSNEAILFGMNHHAPADNASFAVTLENVSRLGIEKYEKRRIGFGAVEKSQRYVTLDGDYVRPKEFSREDLAKFERLIEVQNQFYFETRELILENLKRRNASRLATASDEERKKILEGLEGQAKEDARYSLSFATKVQLGSSLSATAAEHMIRTLKYGPLEEERELARQLFDEIRQYAPSLIQLADAETFRQHNPGCELDDDNFRFTPMHLRELVSRTIRNSSGAGQWFRENPNGVVRFIKRHDITKVICDDIDTNIVASLIHENSLLSIEESYGIAQYILHPANHEQGSAFLREALKYIGEHDKVPRAFEVNAGIIYEAILSASAFAQMKRHRIMTLLSQDYDPRLGITIPKNVAEVGAEKKLVEVCSMSSELFDEFRPRYGEAAQYCLTNAHRRRVIVAANLREHYHISRLREDKHAQWDIRGLVKDVSEIIRQQAPFTSLLLGGKDDFRAMVNRIYSK